MPGGFRVASSNGFVLAWVYAQEGAARSADPNSLTHREAFAMVKAIATLAEEE